ncbi:hypothetical protein CYMTET_51807 [Cymbomonas tetramitiformis]|uniref:Protochlorophyllide reductase n=1 Tax=Cymbomonas tetramitiformis TaxID=36881 RepID=A0AAE0BKA0_9CHLO|nr:hypothetical protein CYMTET_51807 [Cymbomonas tetramitiformis]
MTISKRVTGGAAAQTASTDGLRRVTAPRLKRPLDGDRGVAGLDGLRRVTGALRLDGELHKRYHDATGVKFMSFYPGCIAESALFREAPKAFQVIFPLFQKYITKGYVSEEEAGKRLGQVVSEAQYGESGAYWRFGGESGTEIFKDEPGLFGVKDALGITETATKEVSDRVEGDEAAAKMLWELSEELVGLKA